MCIKSVKLNIFQFKFLHRRLPTNFFLHKITIKDSDRCTFCEEERETLIHLFWNCNLISLFWKNTFKWLQSCLIKGKYLVMTIALGLRPDISNAKLQINFCCLISRYYIWVCKMKNEIPNLSHCLRLLETYEIETKESTSPSEKWKPLLGHF